MRIGREGKLSALSVWAWEKTGTIKVARVNRNFFMRCDS